VYDASKLDAKYVSATLMITRRQSRRQIMKFHVFYTSEIPNQIVNDHRDCCNKIGIEAVYHQHNHKLHLNQRYSDHGEFITTMMANETCDVVCFMDIDCLPHNIKQLELAYDWVTENKSFTGNAQNTSHTLLNNYIYAAASMLMIHKFAWETLGRPSLTCFIDNDKQIDTAELLTLRAIEAGFHYRLMYPIGYDLKRNGQAWKLSGYGDYCHGTLYPATWHYFKISDYLTEIPELWSERVGNILGDQNITPKYPSIYYK